MKVVEIAFSCYPVTDVARARSFYEGVLGLTVTAEMEADEHQWIEYDIGSGTLAIGRNDGWKPSGDGCSVALEVEDFDAAVSKLQAAEVTVTMGPLETPVCHMVMVSDPDGNTVIIHKRKPGQGSCASS